MARSWPRQRTGASRAQPARLLASCAGLDSVARMPPASGCSSAPRTVALAPGLLAALHRHCRAEAPREFAGALGGERHDDVVRVTTVLPLANVASDDDAFVVAPAAFVAAEATLRAAGRIWLGFVHSHPRGAATPSQRDRTELWRNCVQAIVGGAPRATLRAFWFAGEHCRELPLHVAAEDRR
jgi:proteasome lid subunit RPN8/RPN11